MKLEVDQKKVCSIEKYYLDNILNQIKEDDWLIDDYRNKVDNMEHVNSIPIHHSPKCGYDPNSIYSVEKRVLYKKYYPLIKPILEQLKKYYTYNFHASFIAKLKSFSEIGIHRDMGDFVMKGHRVYVPLQTNKNVKYWIEGKEYNWERGYAYEFDNSLAHGVLNESDQPRIHLVLNLYNLSEDELKKTNNTKLKYF